MRTQLLVHDKMQECLALTGTYQNIEVLCTGCYCAVTQHREEKAWIELGTVVLVTGGFSIEGHLNLGCGL